jgi:membrane dipeptidase
MTTGHSRRKFIVLSGTAAIAASLNPRLRAASNLASGGDAEALYRTAFVLDCNALASIGQEISDNDEGAADLQTLHTSGVSAIKCTLGGYDADFEHTVADIAAAQSLIERHPEIFIKVSRFEDLDRAKRERKVALIFSFEGAAMLEDKLDRIELFRRLDVRVMQLAYNHKSPFGYGCLEGEDGGVTDLGHQAIAKMNALGIALDLSHSNTRTTTEGIGACARPPLITHAGCRAVYAHPRNKEDRDMRALADKGGVMGIYMLPYLTEPARQPMLEDYMRHMTHALDVCGEEHVGIGTDVPFFVVTDDDLKEMAKDVQQRQAAGVSAPGENRPTYIPDLNTPRKLEKVTEALLQRGYSARVAEKVLGLNFRRAFKEIWVA